MNAIRFKPVWQSALITLVLAMLPVLFGLVYFGADLIRVDLAYLAANIAEDARFEAEAARRGLKFNAEGDAPVMGDADLLHRAIENVVRNAVKFTREGTSVEVNVHTTEKAAVLTVSDQGPGITTAELAKVFDPFYRGEASNGAPGFGLGLAIAQRAIDAHGGVEADLRQQQQELLPAGPAQAVVGPHPLPAGPRKVLKDGVARLVPMRIVDGLEVIDVDHGNAQAGSGALVGGECLIEKAQDMAAVRQSGKLIGP